MFKLVEKQRKVFLFVWCKRIQLTSTLSDTFTRARRSPQISLMLLCFQGTNLLQPYAKKSHGQPEITARK